MGKKQHQSDKLYISHTEWKHQWGGKKNLTGAQYKRLPLNCCSISFLPFTDPYCDNGGMLYDLGNIVPYLRKYKTNPCTGEPMTPKELFKVNFSKNELQEFQCPVTRKPINLNSKVACISTSGNVYLYDTIERLNIKNNNWKDLMSDESFKRADIIILQDPSLIEKSNYTEFYHYKNRLKVISEEESRMKNDPMYRIGYVNQEFKNTMAEHKKEKEKEQQEEKLKAKPILEESESDEHDEFVSQMYSDNQMAASLTCSSNSIVTNHRGMKLDKQHVRYTKITKKGYVTLYTNFGNLNIELYCHLAPKTCENFILLCQKKYYNNMRFHRLVRHFMVQTGDPTGTGRGGTSAWGEPFEDECRLELSHDKRGILSMSNSGPGTNTSQFFITFRACRQLDKLHTVFGYVVGGMDVLSKIEVIETDREDKPKERIFIEKTFVYTNPFAEYDEEKRKRKEKKKLEKMKEVVVENEKVPLVSYRKGVGMYIADFNSQNDALENKDNSVLESNQSNKKLKRDPFTNFNQW